jgi:sugar O-acyltransferase (sialic acid O-acetyltransferase NeuD family)
MFIYGAGGHGKVVSEIAEVLGFTIEVFIDSNTSIQKCRNIPVVTQIPNHIHSGILGIGDNKIRKIIATNLKLYELKILVHPRSNISKSVSIGTGTVIMPGVSINADVNIGEHTIINTNASIDHDCELENFVHISPNVALSGGVHIGEGTHIGVGACLVPGIKIGRWATIGAGAVIIKDVPDYSVVVGNPGRIIKLDQI